MSCDVGEVTERLENEQSRFFYSFPLGTPQIKGSSHKKNDFL